MPFHRSPMPFHRSPMPCHPSPMRIHRSPMQIHPSPMQIHPSPTPLHPSCVVESFATGGVSARRVTATSRPAGASAGCTSGRTSATRSSRAVSADSPRSVRAAATATITRAIVTGGSQRYRPSARKHRVRRRCPAPARRTAPGESFATFSRGAAAPRAPAGRAARTPLRSCAIRIPAPCAAAMERCTPASARVTAPASARRPGPPARRRERRLCRHPVAPDRAPLYSMTLPQSTKAKLVSTRKWEPSVCRSAWKRSMG
jgi:hypothetical protein